MKSIKQSVKVLALISITSALAVTRGFAQAGPVVTVDEFGKGSFNGNPLPSAIGVDPFSGIATLVYTLPFGGSPGDVVMLEPGPTPQQTTDILRFDGNGSLYFFSERETSDVPPFDPADVAQLPGLIAGFPTVFIQEVGPEGNNGAFYTPNPGDPGFQLGAVVSYNFISDVPEPRTGLLAILGGGLFMALKFRRQTARN